MRCKEESFSSIKTLISVAFPNFSEIFLAVEDCAACPPADFLFYFQLFTHFLIALGAV